MDALLAYDSTDSEDEAKDINSSSAAEEKSKKTLEKCTKTSSWRADEVESSPKIQDLSHNLLTQRKSQYSYEQFNSSLIPYNDHQRWIPSNLLPKTNTDNSDSSPELIQFGPQRSEDNTGGFGNEKYIGQLKSAVGPTRHKEDVSNRKDHLKSRPYLTKKEREITTFSVSQTTKDGIGNSGSTCNKNNLESNSKKSTFKPRPYIPKRERERLQNAIPSTKNSLVVEGRSNEHKTTHNSSELTAVARCDHKCNDENIESKIDSTLTVVNKPPKKILYQFKGHSKCINHVKWNPVQHEILSSASMDGTIGLWDIKRNGLCLSTLTVHQAAVKDVKWASCGTQLLSCGFDKCAKLTDIQTGKVMSNFPHREFVTCVQYHPTDNHLFLAGTSRNGIYCWDTRLEKIVSAFQAPFGQVQDIAFLPGGEEFISAAEVLRRNSTDKGIMVWDFRTTAVMSNQVYQEAFTCTCLKVHPSGTFFGAQSNADYIALFSTKRPYKLNKYKRYEGHQVAAYVVGFDFSPDGSITISGSADGNVYIYNSNTSHVISAIPVHASVCMDVDYNPSIPSMVAACSFDGDIALLV